MSEIKRRLNLVLEIKGVRRSLVIVAVIETYFVVLAVVLYFATTPRLDALRWTGDLLLLLASLLLFPAIIAVTGLLILQLHERFDRESEKLRADQQR